MIASLLMAVGIAHAGYERKVVCEELTGTWCVYCPSGIVAIEEVSAEYEDIFIPIAVHVNDVMTVPEYSGMLMERLGQVGAPYAYTMRNSKYSGSVGDLKTRVGYLSLSEAPGMIKIEGKYEDDGSLHVSGTVVSDAAVGAGEWSLELVLTENEVHHPGDPRYNQSNGYSGNDMVEMGGYELLPNPVPSEDMYYNDVARALYSVDVSSEVLAAGEEREFTAVFAVPESVDDIEKCYVTGLLLDSGGSVVNGWRSRVEVRKEDGIASVGGGDAVVVRRYDVSGRLVSGGYRGVVIEVLSDGSRRKVVSR